MTKNLNIIILAIAFVVVQACATKTEKEVTEETPQETVVPTIAERKAKLEEQRLAMIEKKRLEREEQFKKEPFFTDGTGKIVYNKSEVDPSFVGGDDAMMKYLSDNVSYPKEAEENELEGTVFVDFVVTEAGTVRDVTVTDATSDEVDQSFRTEAIRVVSSMPKWIPGRQNGKFVDVKYSLPITFRLI